ncbi:MAG: SHOCT domain-containing protein [Clostridia bacterium]|nr:SHOCT domain-containing protein [Clostridia bacterium]
MMNTTAGISSSNNKTIAIVFSALAVFLVLFCTIYQYAVLEYSLYIMGLLYRIFEIIPAVSVLVIALIPSGINTRKLFSITFIAITASNLFIIWDLIRAYPYDNISLFLYIIVAILCIISAITLACEKDNKVLVIITAVSAFIADCFYWLMPLKHMYGYPELITRNILMALSSLCLCISVLMFYIALSATSAPKTEFTGAAAELKDLTIRLQKGLITPEEFGAMREEIVKRL